MPLGVCGAPRSVHKSFYEDIKKPPKNFRGLRRVGLFSVSGVC
jgi:hypothetical protein